MTGNSPRQSKCAALKVPLSLRHTSSCVAGAPKELETPTILHKLYFNFHSVQCGYAVLEQSATWIHPRTARQHTVDAHVEQQVCWWRDALCCLVLDFGEVIERYE